MTVRRSDEKSEPIRRAGRNNRFCSSTMFEVTLPYVDACSGRKAVDIWSGLYAKSRLWAALFDCLRPSIMSNA
eukprot:5655438-Pleurochrysis_carterae.AAC.1